MTYGPTLPFSEEVHAEKYRGKNESFKEAMNRVANALKDDEDHFKQFRKILLDMSFMPAGRIQASVGSPKNTTPYNCFVSGSIQDSFIEGHGSIMAMATEAAATMRMGGGIGYDFSTLRPRGDLIRKLKSQSSGPISFMTIFDAICKCVSSSGHRRGAQMGVLRVDHPDIEEFIHAKQPSEEALPIQEQLVKHEPGSAEWAQWNAALQSVLRLTGFNVSVALTDDFMTAVDNDGEFDLKFDNTVYSTVSATSLWEAIMRSTWDWAEPGCLFIDTINKMNNLWYCERIAATNPCGEQPLPPYGACLLGSFNLTRYIYKDARGNYVFEEEQFIDDIPVVVRAMDNVINKAVYPLYEQEQEAKAKRRMGLGVTGVANALEAMGHPYGSPSYIAMQDKILGILNRESYRASAMLAQEKGVFPLYAEKEYLMGEFVQTLDEETRHLIKTYGMRNSHLTSIAPTGTISMCADNISSGIEPVFAYEQARVVNMPGGKTNTQFTDYGVRVFEHRGKRCEDVSVSEHLDVLSSAAKNVDSAVSKTCNVPSTTPWEDFKGIYMAAWRRGCKGITTYQVGGRRTGILESKDDEAHEKAESCRIDPETGRKECD